ncbi:MAG: aminopeptidase N [Halofilum sp. (in: g-proteobacteria)]|nr:aminopeptidase N [Halofilum sp. (in: g-proteobacteria)]
MKNDQATPKPIRLADYTPPAYTIETADLRFDLDPATTRVTATLRVRRHAGAPGDPLVLNGEHLDLISVAIDGSELGADAYSTDDRTLTIPEPPESFELTVVTETHPQDNTALEGLYQSSGNFCTQCEAEGFRRITYFLDRPDVMATYSVTIVADKTDYPVLLSNGNPVDAGELDDGRHWARWEDPFPKPCYLFALVAGDLACHEDTFTTHSGREVTLRIYTEPHNEGKTDHAMASLKKAMRWDEETFGLEYDLDLFQIVSVDDFNMGAMENKGLNVFNSKLVLANPDTATDADFQAIEAVIAHEYFHNWTGNRITCRDWFQLSLKEGLTVFRDQQFSADMGSAPVKRIEDVRMLRTQQFPEDNGPMAHPVRPDHYIKIDNFYTLTVYEKGAEVIRMMHTLLGEEGFRKGMDLYFQRHDGQAVTCDDFAAAMADANGRDLTQFKRWYSQAGTPHLKVEEAYDEKASEYYLTVRQHTPPTQDQTDKQPVVIPLRMGLIGRDGEPVHVNLSHRETTESECVLEITEEEQTFVFEDVPERPVASLLRGFSAPVILERDLDDDTLRFQMKHDTDAFNRWDAGQTLFRRRVIAAMADLDNGLAPKLPEPDAEAFREVLNSETLDDALKAEALTLPSAEAVGEDLETIEPDKLVQARDTLINQLAEALEEDLKRTYGLRANDSEYTLDAASIGRRRLKNLCLSYLGHLERNEYIQLAIDQINVERNMTDVIAGLRVLSHLDIPEREEELNAFYEKWKHDPLVTDKWLALQATAKRDNVVEDVKRLMEHPAFNRRNPNRIRSLIGAFAMANFEGFHRADGEGYRLLADFVIELDPVNPQIASRLVQAMIRWRRFDGVRQNALEMELRRVMSASSCSENTYEVVSRAVG